jgi:hypothetical protein
VREEREREREREREEGRDEHMEISTAYLFSGGRREDGVEEVTKSGSLDPQGVTSTPG